MVKIDLRYPRLGDARRFYEILNNPKFIHFNVKPESIEAEREWIKGCPEKRKTNYSHEYAILYKGEVVGGCGIKINQHRTYIGEIGYFIDEDCWGKGIATRATKMLERICFEELNVSRVEILMKIENKASERVAIKCGYKKEGIMKKTLKQKDTLCDCYLYAKVK